MPQRIISAREQYELSSPWHYAYDIQSPPPGEPMRTKLGPFTQEKGQPRQYFESEDPRDPMAHLRNRPYDYDTMVNNLVSHYHGASDDERKQGRLWYKAAHDLFHTFAKKNNITPERAVAYGSAFSPLTDWGDNVHHAQKFMLGYKPTLEDGSPNPDFNPHDWQTAHIAQGPLDAFRSQAGRDPTESDDDLHALADLHQGQWPVSKADAKKGLLGKHDIANNPEARQQWMDNIQHKGMPAILEDQARQAEAWRKSPKTSGPYNPDYSMRASGINTLGGNIQKAKNLYHSPEDVAQMFKVLGGPKISHFTDNILDDTPIDSEGYYQHPNGDWKQNQDLGGTIDSHHIRASSMPHGGWERKAYASKNPSTDHEYDVFNRGLYDATDRINSGESDPTKHITPKQLQAIVWLKHKNDKDYFERQRNPQTGALISHESELGGAGRPADWQFAEKSYKSKGKGLGKGPSRAAALTPEDFANMPPIWRKVFFDHEPQEWTDLLADYVHHVSPHHPEGPTDPRLAALDPDEYLQAITGPSENPWKGQEAEELAKDCPWCHAPAHEPCEPNCPTNHSDDPRDWEMDARAIGDHWKPGPELDPMRRQNSVDRELMAAHIALAQVDDLFRTAAEQVPAHSLNRGDRLYVGGNGPNAIYKVLQLGSHPAGLNVSLKNTYSGEHHELPVRHDFPFDLAWRAHPEDLLEDEDFM